MTSHKCMFETGLAHYHGHHTMLDTYNLFSTIKLIKTFDLNHNPRYDIKNVVCVLYAPLINLKQVIVVEHTYVKTRTAAGWKLAAWKKGMSVNLRSCKS